MTVPLGIRLKIEAAVRGVSLGPDLELEIGSLGAGHRREGGRRVELVLPGDVWTTAMVIDGDGGLRLSGNLSAARLESNGAIHSARVVAPEFYRRSTTSGRPMLQVGSVHGPFLAINSSAACSVGLRGAACRYCRVGTPVPAAEGFPMSVADVVETVRAAFGEGYSSAVYFNTGYLGGDDGGIAFLEPFVRAVKRNFATVVAVQLHPPRSNAWIDRAYAMGVDALSFGLEVHDAVALQRMCAGRMRFIGRERYYEALAYAASVFPRGTVWTELLVGAEPLDSTRQAIDLLVRDGVLPVLCAVPAVGSGPGGIVGLPPIDDVVDVCRSLYRAVHGAQIPIGWVRDMSFAITPYEARLLAGAEQQISAAEEYFYRSAIRGFAARNLSRFRRRLRVRQVSDPALEDHG